MTVGLNWWRVGVSKNGEGERQRSANLEDAFEEGLHALGEDGVALGVGDEGGAGEEDVLEGFGGPSTE
jgi:hypothetical protein